MNAYEKSEPLRGDPMKAIEFAAVTLAAAGFRIERPEDGVLRARGPGMNNNRNGLLAVASIELRISGGTIRARAELGGGKRLFITLGVMIGVMAIAGATATLILSGRRNTPHGVSFLPLLALAPWPILLPAMYYWTNRAGRRAVDTLLNNAAQMAR